METILYEELLESIRNFIINGTELDERIEYVENDFTDFIGFCRECFLESFNEKGLRAIYEYNDIEERDGQSFEDFRVDVANHVQDIWINENDVTLETPCWMCAEKEL